MTKSVTAALHIAMTLVLFFWIRKNDLSVKYGFCKSKYPAKRFLFYIPLIIIASASLWNGIHPGYGFPGTLLFVVSMCCVGFLEEVIFRGLLFRAMEKDNVKTAIIVSAVTFGLGHIVNLFTVTSCTCLLSYMNMWAFMGKKMVGEYCWTEGQIFRYNIGFFIACCVGFAVAVPYWASIGYI